MEASLISALVSLSVVLLSRWVFSRSDRRFPILVLIQQELLKLKKAPSWSTNGDFIYFEKVKESLEPLSPYFDQLRMVSYPRQNCSIQKKWAQMVKFDGKKWLKENPKRVETRDYLLTKEEYIEEINKLLKAIANG